MIIIFIIIIIKNDNDNSNSHALYVVHLCCVHCFNNLHEQVCVQALNITVNDSATVLNDYCVLLSDKDGLLGPLNSSHDSHMLAIDNKV